MDGYSAAAGSENFSGNEASGSHGNDSGNNNPQPIYAPGKIHIEGFSVKTTLDDLVHYFSMYGQIKHSRLVNDHMNEGHRYAFLTFKDLGVVDTLLSRSHTIDSKEVKVQRALGQKGGCLEEQVTNKISVTGIPPTTTEDQLSDFFGRFGEVIGVEIIHYQFTIQVHAMGVVTYSSEDTVDNLLSRGCMMEFAGVQVEIKKTNPTIPNLPGGGFDDGRFDDAPRDDNGTDAGAMGAPPLGMGTYIGGPPPMHTPAPAYMMGNMGF